ncbi:MAG: hypothetical protein ACTSQF_14940 [Candidatus Heimdallarchaeaceae archaeon]
MKVEVRPIDIPKWHDKAGEEAFNQSHVIEALYSSVVGGYNTGLTEEEAKNYGKELGKDLSNTFDPEEPHPFWSSKMAQIRLENKTMFFDTERVLENVKLKVMKASKYVANSLKAYNDGEYPEATHVIFDEEEDIELKATKIQKGNKATMMAMKLSKDAQLSLIQILSGKSLRNRSQNFIDVEIAGIIKNKLDKFLRYAQMDKKDLYLRASVLEAIHRNILTKEGTSVFYMSDKLGFDTESTIEWFADPQNQQMKVAILEKLNK